MRNKPNILVVYGYLDFPLRTSVRDLIYSFHKDKNCTAFIYSIEQGPFPEYLKKVYFDLIIFTTVLLGERWGGQEKMYTKVYKPLEYLINYPAIKIVHPQDEWIHTNSLNNFINDFKINYVFSVAPESEWKKIYDKVNFNKVKFYRVLTGYLEHETVQKLNKITNSGLKQSVDIGYRAYKSPPWLGSHGYLKTKIADIFSEEAPKVNFSIDISTEEKDTKLGDDWLNFIASCKYFIGAEGGSTILDRDGAIFKKGTVYSQTRPNASFEEFEKNCFPMMDGNLKLIAISPRHLEACAAKTCQILVEGDYNGILKPNIHYIELKKDFSNLKDVFEKMKNEELRKKIVDTAFTDIVVSEKYSYIKYTNYILSRSLTDIQVNKKSSFQKVLLFRNRISDIKFWRGKQKMHHLKKSSTER